MDQTYSPQLPKRRHEEISKFFNANELLANLDNFLSEVLVSKRGDEKEGHEKLQNQNQ